MDKPTIERGWNQLRQQYGIYLRILEALPEDRLHTHPIPGIRTPAQMAAHVSGSIVRDFAEGIAKGEITVDESAEPEVAEGLAGTEDVLAFARECWERADRAVEGIGEEELQAIVPTPWGVSFPGWVGFQVLSEELLHHRGQLAAYCRVCGVAPPFIYDFEANAPEFRPERVAAAD